MQNSVDRLMAERKMSRKDRKYLFFANPVKENGKLNMMKWKCSFPGPNNELYKNSYFRVTIMLSKDYPFKPPKVVFDKSTFHPNIYACGTVCLDILSSAWKPTMGIMQVLTALQQLLSTPNINSPANGQAAEAWRNGRPVYEKKVKENIFKNHQMPNFKYIYKPK